MHSIYIFPTFFVEIGFLRKGIFLQGFAYGFLVTPYPKPIN